MGSRNVNISLYVWQKPVNNIAMSWRHPTPGWPERRPNPDFGLATKQFRAIDLSCRACGAGAGCWAWIPGRAPSVFFPNLRYIYIYIYIYIYTDMTKLSLIGRLGKGIAEMWGIANDLLIDWFIHSFIHWLIHWFDSIWFDSIWFDLINWLIDWLIWFDLISFNLIWLIDLIWFDSIWLIDWFDLIWFDYWIDWFDLIWSIVWFDLIDWLSDWLDWIALEWIGLNRIGLDWMT